MKLSHDRKILLLALLAGLPALLATTVLLWLAPVSDLLRGTILGGLVVVWLSLARAAQLRVIRPLQVIANLLAGLRGDTSPCAPARRRATMLARSVAKSIRCRKPQGAALGALEAMLPAAYGRDRRSLRVRRRPSARLVNRAASGCWASRPSADRPHRGQLVSSRPRRRDATHSRAGGAGAATAMGCAAGLRQGGLRSIWWYWPTSAGVALGGAPVRQRLCGCSPTKSTTLAPIKSLSGTMTNLLDRAPRATDWESDLRKGLEVIGARADALNRFMASYARLAKLPPPTLAPLDVGDWVRRAIQLESRVPVRLIEGPALSIRADGDQLDQVLINLLHQRRGGLRAGNRRRRRRSPGPRRTAPWRWKCR
jgi:hypothetical protein